MMNSVVVAAYTILEAADETHASDELLSDSVRDELSNRVEAIISSAFKESGRQNDAKMSKSQFRKWAMKHPETIDLLDSVFQSGNPAASLGSALNAATPTAGAGGGNDETKSSNRPTANRQASLLTKATPAPFKVECNTCGYCLQLNNCYRCGAILRRERTCETCGPVRLDFLERRRS